MENFAAVLRGALQQHKLVKVRRVPRAADMLTGVCVGVGRGWAALHTISDHVFLNGHSFFRLADVRGVEVIGQEDSLLIRGLKHFGDWPPQALPNIRLDTVQQVVEGAAAASPLVTVHLDRRYPDTCYIGRPLNFDGRYLRLQEVDPQARWDDTERYAWGQITLVEIDQRYERTLAALAGPPPEPAATPRIVVRVDFNNVDTRTRVRLTTCATSADAKLPPLRNGQRVLLVDGDMSEPGTVEYSDEEQIWTARWDWRTSPR